MEDDVYSITKTVIAEIVAKEDQYIKRKLIEYAQKRSRELGEKIEVLFIDKDVADEVIELGAKAYMRKKMLQGG